MSKQHREAVMLDILLVAVALGCFFLFALAIRGCERL